jgi:dTDP-glucose 4,6-dehydratase
VEELFKQHGFEAVIHFAAESHVDRSIHDPDSFVRTNVLGTQVLINAARRAAQTRFLHVSTDEVYGSLGPTGYFVETTPLDPSSPYSASKAGSDLLVLAAHKTHGLNAIVTRCTNNYGPYQFPEKFIPLFITNALEDKKLPLYGDGLNVRSWLHVEDHCRALLLILERGRAGQIYNIGGAGEAELPNIAVAKMILEILGKQQSLIQLVSDRPAHDRRYAIDYSKLRQELGWEPVITFEQGLRETVSWYLQEQRWWQKVKSGEYLSFYEKNYAKRQAWGAAK